MDCTPPVLGKGQPWHDVADRTVAYTLRVLDDNKGFVLIYR